MPLGACAQAGVMGDGLRTFLWLEPGPAEPESCREHMEFPGLSANRCDHWTDSLP